MPNSKNNSARSGKQKAFSQEQQHKAHKQQQSERGHIVPSVLWESDDALVLQGAALEAYNKTIEVIYHGLQQLGQIYQQIVAINMKSEKNPNGKIRVQYKYENGEEVSEQDLKIFMTRMQEVNALRAQQQSELEQKAAALEQTKEDSGLVTVDGAPLTKETLEKKNKIVS